MVRNLSAGDKLQYFWGPNPERSNYSEELGKDDENWYDAEIETPDDSTPSQKSEWLDNLKQIKDAEKAAKSFMRNEDIEDDEEEDEEEDGEEDAHANIRNGVMGAPCCIIKKGIHYGKK